MFILIEKFHFVVKKDSCIIQIENPEEVQEVKIYPPDIHYNFRFNFNLVPLCMFHLQSTRVLFYLKLVSRIINYS